MADERITQISQWRGEPELTEADWGMLYAARDRYREAVKDDVTASVFSTPLTENQCRTASLRLNGEGEYTVAYLMDPGTRNRPCVWAVLFGTMPFAK